MSTSFSPLPTFSAAQTFGHSQLSEEIVVSFQAMNLAAIQEFSRIRAESWCQSGM